MSQKKNFHFFNTYESFINEIPSEYEYAVRDQYTRGSFHRLLISSFLFFIIILFSLLRDIFTGFYHRPTEPYNFLHLIAFIIMICATLIVIGFGIKNKRIPLDKIVLIHLHRLFYICINIALGLFMFNEFYRGYYTTYEQFYWLFFAFVPLMHLRSNFLNMSVSLTLYLLEYIIIMIVHDETFLNFLYIAPIILTMEFFGLYLRQHYLNTIIYDIQNQILQKKLKDQSIIDPLTGCYNRYALKEQFENISAEEEKLSLFMFDIDMFKMYNDTFSHVEGDSCLKQICSAIMSTCQSNQMALFRYGGEEFIILSRITGDARIEAIATELLETVRSLKLATPALPEFGNIVTISVGAATVPADLLLRDSIRCVDEQLYMAKAHGRNCAFYKNEKIQ